ncbi:uncharacterized protein LTR77_005912 [Saxophila tyrrhenica]|uniref:SURF6-domain-containing protein n=1 Tax=Saxophila tyrrhenica TaxID=1690608 RepID=A0AAV9P798_9PEZI|nr:hypothetical protein LTR77_005912 [Saxophila tyrrhenica]
MKTNSGAGEVAKIDFLGGRGALFGWPPRFQWAFIDASGSLFPAAPITAPSARSISPSPDLPTATMTDSAGAGHEDPLEGLEERLQSHNKAFESLLALTPAREYYGSHFVDGKDPSEQWNRKKQTKEEKRAAKKAKLDPKNNKSALDVLREREAEALKRKRGEDNDGGDDEEGDSQSGKAQKRAKGEDDADAAEARRRQKVDKRKEKRQAKQEKKQAKQAKAEEKKARKQDRQLDELKNDGRKQDADEDAEEGPAEDKGDDMEAVDFSGLTDAQENGMKRPHEERSDAGSDVSSAPTTPLIDSPAFDLGTNHSAASSSSSIVPPSSIDQETTKRPAKTDTKAASTAFNGTDPVKTDNKPTNGVSSPKPHIPKITDAEKTERLRKRIEELRAARKADDKPARSRQELLEQRRKKEEQRKTHKKELRRKAKEEEERRKDEQLRGSGSPLTSDIFSPRSPLPADNAYSFSRLAFEDGTSADPELHALKDARKKKGPQDPKTALKAAQSKDSRIAGYDAEKQADIADKDMWMNARKKAHGERVRDDTSLLKKALKRKEKQKSKSEQQWKEREQAVTKGREMKQKKRETNLAKRKEEKGSKGKKSAGKGGKGAKGAKKGKKRAGFEGSFKA